jgi:hypothetical protein
MKQTSNKSHLIVFMQTQGTINSLQVLKAFFRLGHRQGRYSTQIFFVAINTKSVECTDCVDTPQQDGFSFDVVFQ